MVFSSHVFLFIFLPVFLALYTVAPRPLKNFVALVASYLFYSWGAPEVVLMLLLSSAADYLLSKFIERDREGRSGKLALIAGLAFNLGLLGYYKYANFFVAESNRVFRWFGLEPFSWTEIALPIGISFFTFQKISYLVDVYRGTTPAARRFLEYALFVSLFPQLIAGPIIRYHDLANQIQKRTQNLNDIFYGFYRFCMGLGKKVLIANPMGEVADNVFALSPEVLNTPYAWLGITCYAFQIYFDFSGYSDMAIGLGRMMGFEFLENFNYPYISRNITEFWRRWHISLSNWMKEYLYFSLGGNRVGKARMYMNLWIVFLLSGLWHGASWNFILWGVFHGTFLVFDKLFWLKASYALPRPINIALTFGVVLFGWVLFRADTLDQAFYYTRAMLQMDFSQTHIIRGSIIHSRAEFVFMLATVISFCPSFPSVVPYLKKLMKVDNNLPRIVAQSALAVFCLLLSLGSLATSHFNPFLYFRF